ncbi:ATP-dependent helicase [Blautia difficilis]|uniref:DNA 3'-5' helicase n=1 Tax=Blautia difficilis TaxID=2763027 RepID=A0ABR7IGU5_9FIRM|nr:ATP-dependent helicase [Blautia difficilis]MBC5779202.1 ATP-dependent helicase [Blautia difficilis]
MKRNPSQIRAIAHLSGPMMVLAGPGSGKTSVIVERTAYMINEGKISASSILVVTFSRAAAVEMKERFLKFVNRDRSEVTFGTFHGIFYGILKAAYNLNASNILSEEEKYSILREMTEKFGQEMEQEGDFLEEIAKEISVVKGNCISLEHYYASCCSDEVFREIYNGYKNALRTRRKLDFDDMILCCYELFSQRPDILKAWQKKFVYILVDEFQDINSLQYKILQMLAAPANNLFIVGDDDQSIYHFRGARPEIMLNFTRDYPGAETVLLDVNYRCSGNILKTAMNVINCNKKRFRKKLTTPNDVGMPVTCKVFDNPREEAVCVAAALKKRLEKGEKLENTAILLRTNQEAESLITALMEYQIPFTMKEQLPNLYRHWICRNLLAYLHMAAGDRSRKNFLELMNRPNRYISRDALKNSQISFHDLREYYKDKDWMCDRITTLETHLRILGTLSPFAAVNFIRKGMGYEEYLWEYAQFRRLKPEELLEILDRIHESTRGMKNLKQWEDYIEDYTEKLNEQAKRQRDRKEGVTVSTLHAVKGLEYDIVYILNVNEGSIPYRKAVLAESVEEERRLFYVGMTRARRKLVLAYVNRQYEKEREPSRFLEETGL